MGRRDEGSVRETYLSGGARAAYMAGRAGWDAVRIGGLSGIVGPVLGLAMVLAATALDPAFSWARDPLSDLGVGAYAPLFNLAVIISGLSILPLARGLRERLPRTGVNTAGASILAIGGIALAFVGVFTENSPGLHFAMALGYFVLVPIGLILLGAGAANPRHRFFALGAGVGALAAIFGLPAILSGVGFGVPELAEALILTAWFAGTGLEMVLATRLATRTAPTT